MFFEVASLELVEGFTLEPVLTPCADVFVFPVCWFNQYLFDMCSPFYAPDASRSNR